MTDQPGYTRIPNALLELLPTLPGSEARVLLAIIRRTAGWQKECDVISLSQLETATGMSKQGVIDAIDGLMGRGILTRTPAKNNGYCYQVVNKVDSLEQSEKLTSQESRPLVVNKVDSLGPQVVKKVDTQKKDLKEKKERGSARARATHPPKQQSLNNFSEAIQVYKELTGIKAIAPVIADKIAEIVVDCQHWRTTLTNWLGAGYSAKNTDGMIDWYLHPEKMERKNGTHKPERPTPDRRNGTGPGRAAELDAYLKRLPDD